jgi:hypothetical protein
METIEGLREETLTTVNLAIFALAKGNYHEAEVYLALSSQKAARLRALEDGIPETINQ